MMASSSCSDSILARRQCLQVSPLTSKGCREGFRNGIIRSRRRAVVARILGMETIGIKPPMDSSSGNMTKESSVENPGSVSPSAGVAVYQPSGLSSSLAIPAWQLITGVAVTSIASFLAGTMVGMLPVLQAMKSAADEVRDVSKVVKEQVPDTVSAMRLSGLDLSELSSEVTELTRNVSESIRQTNNAIQFVRAGIDLSRTVVGGQVDRIQPISRAAIKAGARVRVTAGSYLARKLRQRMRQDRRRTSIITTQTMPTTPPSETSGQAGDRDSLNPTESSSIFTTRKTEA